MGLYFGGAYFGQYAPAIAAAAAPARPAIIFGVGLWPGRARHAQRRGWRWHQVRYAVLRAGEVCGRRPTFAGALELVYRHGADRIEKYDLRDGPRPVRYWVGAELAAALERFAKRFR